MRGGVKKQPNIKNMSAFSRFGMRGVVGGVLDMRSGMFGMEGVVRELPDTKTHP